MGRWMRAQSADGGRKRQEPEVPTNLRQLGYLSLHTGLLSQFVSFLSFFPFLFLSLSLSLDATQ